MIAVKTVQAAIYIRVIFLARVGIIGRLLLTVVLHAEVHLFHSLCNLLEGLTKYVAQYDAEALPKVAWLRPHGVCTQTQQTERQIDTTSATVRVCTTVAA